MSTNGIFVLLDEIVQKYIKEYFEVKVGDVEENTSQDVFLGTKESELVREISPRTASQDIYAIDGSSRSLTSAGGIISVNTLAISSNKTPIFGVYPSLFGLPSLDLKKPFIGLASSTSAKGKIEPFLFSSNSFVTSVSISGEVFLSTFEPERIETEIRGILETEGMKIVKGKGIVIVDGPLFPSYIYLPDKVTKFIELERSKVIDSNYIGIVKRLDKSKLLVTALKDSKEFVTKYRINPKNFLSDEAFLYQFVKFNYSPPYPTISIGPLIRVVNNIRYYINYLVVPHHKYLPKFSILRIESVSKYGPDIVSSLPFSGDGIPKVLAIADKTAKELSSGIMKYIIYSIEKIGTHESFKTKFEVSSVV